MTEPPIGPVWVRWLRDVAAQTRQFGPVSASPLLGRYQRLEGGDQRWKVGLQGAPDDRTVDVAIVVDEPVAHANHLAPGDLGVKFLCLGGHPVGRLTDDLECMRRRQLRGPVVLERFETQVRDYILRVARGQEHVEQVLRVAPHQPWLIDATYTGSRCSNTCRRS